MIGDRKLNGSFSAISDAIVDIHPKNRGVHTITIIFLAFLN